MADSRGLQRLIELLRRAQRISGDPEASEQWAQRVMRDVRLAGPSLRSCDESSFFLRFSFAAILMTVIVQAVYQFSALEDQISTRGLVQFDPLDLEGAFND